MNINTSFFAAKSYDLVNVADLLQLIEKQYDIGLNSKSDSAYFFLEKIYSKGFNSDTLNVQQLATIAAQVWKVFQVRKRGEISCVYEELKHFHDEKSVCILTVVSADTEHIVSSVLEVCKESNLKLLYYSDNVCGISRDQNGQFISFFKKSVFIEDNIHSLEKEAVFFVVFENPGKEIAHKTVQKAKVDMEELFLCNRSIPEIRLEIDEMSSGFSSKESVEIKDFLLWLKKGNFIFLGYENFLLEHFDERRPVFNKQKSLGLPTFKNFHIHSEVFLQNYNEPFLILAASDITSPVCRRDSVKQIIVYLGYEKKVVVFYGVFNHFLGSCDLDAVPVLRGKFQSLRKRLSAETDGYRVRLLRVVLSSFSIFDLFFLSESDLNDLFFSIVNYQFTNKVKLFIKTDRTQNLLYCFIILPYGSTGRLFDRTLFDMLSCLFGTEILRADCSTLDEVKIVKWRFVLRVTQIMLNKITDEFCIDAENSLNFALTDWKENFYIAAAANKDCVVDEGVLSYGKHASIEYISATKPYQACDDYIYIKNLLNSNDAFCVSIRKYESEYILSIYSLTESSPKFTDLVGIVSNFGIGIVRSSSFTENFLNSSIAIYRFFFDQQYSISDDCMSIKRCEEAFQDVLTQKIDDTYYNSLILLAGLSGKEVTLVTAMFTYLKKIGFGYSDEYIKKAVISHFDIVKKVSDYFLIKFDPFFSGNREESANIALQDATSELIRVSNSTNHKILDAFLELAKAILRTNYFSYKNYLSLKLEPSKVPNLPLPKPYKIIYVFARNFEAVHLRGGKVSRGGLRWSDKAEDLNSEILSLMKAQITKNSVIIPTGAKGGFVLKNLNDQLSRKELEERAVDCYSDFLRGMLEITDNIVGSDVVKPENIIVYDDSDPYLVVAADKGTSAFSDYANAISLKYSFWLGDAFASGGSHGYDHKKIGITARGAFIAMDTQFRELGMSTSIPFTVVGIGDMSGDLFGNGMLLSKNIKLIAAFNHMSIFVDPNPNAISSWDERSRLFHMPRSTWHDYDLSIMSKGGAVFSRKAESVKLSNEIMSLLSLDNNIIEPEELIKRILCLDVDVIWNGGIGTYIKSKDEQHDRLADKGNDRCRVNGCDINAKVFVEGGNLGVTQSGRIEYALKGGKISADFIDNSGGVICSDLEVNIKILLLSVMRDGLISLEERNEILTKITDDVISRVLLRHNVPETKTLSVETFRSKDRLERYSRFISRLKNEGILDTKVEIVLDDEELRRLASEGKGVAKPHLAVLHSYCRTHLKNEIIKYFDKHSIEQDFWEEKYLFDYFPKLLVDRFPDHIKKHSLRREIIATEIANDIVNAMGCTFVSHIAEISGAEIITVIIYYTFIAKAYNLSKIWNSLRAIESKITVENYIKLSNGITEFIGEMVFWLLRHPEDITNVFANANEILLTLDSIYQLCMSSQNSHAYELLTSKAKIFDDITDDIDLKSDLLKLSLFGVHAVNILEIARKLEISIDIAENIYFETTKALYLFEIIDISEKSLFDAEYWNKVAARESVCRLKYILRAITLRCGKDFKFKNIADLEKFDCMLKLNDIFASHSASFDNYLSFVKDVTRSKIKFGILSVITGRLDFLIS